MSDASGRVHRWAWDDEPMSGEPVGFCLNNCGGRWYEGEEEPRGECPGDNRPPAKVRIVSVKR